MHFKAVKYLNINSKFPPQTHHPNIIHMHCSLRTLVKWQVSFTRWDHLGPGWHIHDPGLYCKSNENNRWAGTDSADVSERSNKDISSCSEGVNPFLATVWVQTAWQQWYWNTYDRVPDFAWDVFGKVYEGCTYLSDIYLLRHLPPPELKWKFTLVKICAVGQWLQ